MTVRTVDEAEAERLYVEMKMPVRKVAEKLGTSSMTIYRILDKRGVKMVRHREKPTCRRGHARIFWGQWTSDGRTRCRKCEGRDREGQVHVLRKNEDWGSYIMGVFSTQELAKEQLPDLVWEDDGPDGCRAGDYTVAAFPLDEMEG